MNNRTFPEVMLLKDVAFHSRMISRWVDDDTIEVIVPNQVVKREITNILNLLQDEGRVSCDKPNLLINVKVINPRVAYIMRGLPGSGKSTYARQLAHEMGYGDDHICSTDSFFMVNGVYKFDFKLLNTNHRKNLEKFTKQCEAGESLVICDNTNIAAWQYEKYVQIAKDNGYHVELVVIGEPKDPEHVKLCFERGTHGVPMEAIERMSKGFELP